MNKSFFRKYIVPLIPSIVIIGIFLIFSEGTFNSDNVKSQIKKLKRRNDSLQIQNNLLEAKMDSSFKEVESSHEVISNLMDSDYLKKRNIAKLDSQITNLKTKYEKAKTYSSNYGADDIKRYFADL
jgi:predicted RNase H-like nuclease (RuvC/YqgF family)